MFMSISYFCVRYHCTLLWWRMKGIFCTEALGEMLPYGLVIVGEWKLWYLLGNLKLIMIWWGISRWFDQNFPIDCSREAIFHVDIRLLKKWRVYACYASFWNWGFISINLTRKDLADFSDYWNSFKTEILTILKYWIIQLMLIFFGNSIDGLVFFTLPHLQKCPFMVYVWVILV